MSLLGRIHIPGNLLIAGEYAVLFEGGLGISAGVGPPVALSIEKAQQFEFVARAGTYRYSLVPDGNAGDESDGRGAVFSQTLRVLRDVEQIEQALGPDLPRYAELPDQIARKLNASADIRVRISVDTRALFTTEGRKLGFGSSAAATVAAVAGLLAALEIDPTHHRLLVQRIATAAHRSLQGDVGSGYDIATSIYGGVGLFTGGRHPRYRRIDPPWVPQIGILQGEQPQSTRDAVVRFMKVFGNRSDELRVFLDDNNLRIDTLASACTAEQGFGALESVRDLGVEVGRRIGVPSEVEMPRPPSREDQGCSEQFRKALGAGRETIMVLPYVPGCPGRAVIMDYEGLRWA